jgi:hypothetical protein
MTSPREELHRRRPVWEALSELFLDTGIDDDGRRRIARAIVESGYQPGEVQEILWNEVYPVLGPNLKNPAGTWSGFDLDWMQEQILSGATRRTVSMRIAEALPGSPARMIREEWKALLPLLPGNSED